MMRRLLTGGVGLLGVFLLAACATPAPVGPTDAEMIAGADALDDQFIVAFNAGDAQALGALYAEDAVSFPPDSMEARGQDNIRAAMVVSFAAMPGAKLELSDQRNVVVGAAAVLGYGLWRMTMAGPDGVQTQMDGRYSDVKVLRNGRWLYLIDHASVPLPPPPAG